MTSHYLFFEQKDAINFIDPMRPRTRPGQERKPFNFEMCIEERYGGLALYVMTDAQRERIRGKARPAVTGAPKPREAICTVSDMVTADLVEFTNEELREKGQKAFRADFFSPVRREYFAYATPYGKGRFAEEMRERKGLQLEMLQLQDYACGQSVHDAVKAVFATYYLALVNNNVFTKYSGRGLAVIAPGKLIEGG